MKLSLALLAASLVTSTAASAIDNVDNVVRSDLQPGSDEHDLYKRRGGGGGGGRGGGGGSSGGSRGSSGGSRGSSGGGGGGGGLTRGGTSSSGNTQRGSNLGGVSPGGSGARPVSGGFYGGGAAVPYRAGGQRRLPTGALLVPALVVGGALAFWPIAWAGHSYLYDYGEDMFRYHNVTTDEDESRRVKCACAEYALCSCGDEINDDVLKRLVGNGSYAALNKTLIDVARIDGRMTLLVNGTLPNGTTADSNSEAAISEYNRQNGDDDDDDSAAASMQAYFETVGLWPVIGSAIVAAVFMA